jgi:hypothetical protein
LLALGLKSAEINFISHHLFYLRIELANFKSIIFFLRFIDFEVLEEAGKAEVWADTLILIFY